MAVEVNHTPANSASIEVIGKEPDNQSQVEVDLHTQHEAGCSYGCGAARKTGKYEFCKYYKSRCLCFCTLQSCSDKCSCHSCANQEKGISNPLPRKRKKQDLQQDIKQTDRAYMKNKTEVAHCYKLVGRQSACHRTGVFVLASTARKMQEMDQVSTRSNG